MRVKTEEVVANSKWWRTCKALASEAHPKTSCTGHRCEMARKRAGLKLETWTWFLLRLLWQAKKKKVGKVVVDPDSRWNR